MANLNHPLKEKLNLQKLLNNGELNTIKEQQASWSVYEVIRLMQELPSAQRILLFRLLDKDRAIDVFERLDTTQQTDLVQAMADPEAVQLFEKLDPDLRVHLFDELPAKVTKRLLAALSPEARESVNVLLNYPPESVGRIMNPRYLAVRSHNTVREALAVLRSSNLEDDELRVIFVIDEKRYYKGVVSLTRLVRAEPDAKIETLLEGSDVFVRASEKRTVAARLLKQYDLVALPVVDGEGRLVGAVSFDDVIDVLEEEASETMYQMAGIVDVRRQRDIIHSEKLTRGPILYAVSVRIVFLLVTVAGGLVTGGLIDQFEEVLAKILAAAVFIPLVMDMGGNVGTQSTTIFARGLALGHIDLAKFWWHVRREVGIGLVMGLLLGVVTGVIAWQWQGIPNGFPQIGIAVGVSICAVVTLATFLGFLLPYTLTKLGFDHAPGADPFITTIKDFTGLALYFSLVNFLLAV
ncbi:magnesium transporter [Caldilinea sp.]|uniref:magnesium transporter n=1 Tax=Caldilinea sp. TaxID=2293560 RepID=UPI0021DE57FD|nr:magnesium transporter [Caldilinea sp.]GIV68155.1 MAG: magnesium transporter MgtE [Caldilinea sp.]